ncbi:MAG: hypothetical protein EA422_13570 [Gemmatimonadales bacterium]|nr:MAG: hypothetical protein EA422_13570 [Gemmatimonadales bacterium]
MTRIGTSLFPVMSLARRLIGPGKAKALSPSGIGFSCSLPSGASVDFEVRHLDIRLPNRPPLVEEVRIRYRSSRLDALEAWQITEINRLAALSGLVRCRDAGELEFVAKVGVFAGDEAATERIYAPLMGGAVFATDWIVQCLTEGRQWVDPSRSPFHSAGDPSPLMERDLRSAQEWILEPRGWFGSRDAWGLTAEYPWDAAGGTCLLWIREDSHPFLGNGVMATLEVPIQLDGEEPVALMAELNAWEVESPELPPYFGAWTPGFEAPCFSVFVPNELCVNGIAQHLSAWAVVRTVRLRRWMGVGAPVH